MNIGEKLKSLRLERGLTLNDVAIAVGVGKSTVHKWESGHIMNMGRDKIVLIAKALGVTPAYLLGVDDDDEKEEVKEQQSFFAPKTKEARIISGGIDKMPEDARKRAVQLYEVFFAEFAEYFKDKDERGEDR